MISFANRYHYDIYLISLLYQFGIVQKFKVSVKIVTILSNLANFMKILKNATL